MQWLKNTRATGIGFTLLGLVVLVLSLRLEAPRHMPYGPGVFPSAIGALMALGGLVVALGGKPDRHSATTEPPAPSDIAPASDNPAGSGPTRGRMIPFLVYAVAPLIFILILPILGFLIATPLLIALLVVVSGGRWPTAIVTGIISTLLLQTVFQQAMRVPLPWGLLEPYAGVLTWM